MAGQFVELGLAFPTPRMSLWRGERDMVRGIKRTNSSTVPFADVDGLRVVTRPDIAERVTIACAGLLAPVATLAPNGLAVLLAVVGLVVSIADPDSRRLAGVPRALVVLAGVFMAWAGFSVAWSLEPEIAASSALRLSIAAYFGLVLVSRVISAEPASRDRIGTWLLRGYAFGLAVVLTEMLSQFLFGEQNSIFSMAAGPAASSSSFLNRPKTVLVILLPLATFVAMRRNGKLLAACLILLCAVAVSIGESLASAVALAVGAAGVAVGLAMKGRIARATLAATVLAYIVAAPTLAHLPVVAETATRRDVTVSIFHRAAIWSFVAARIDERPIVGWGMHASRSVPGGGDHITETAERIPLHPHNAPLQIRLELGLIGAVLAGLIGAYVARAAGSSGAAAVATFSVALFVASVSYGIWQGWWFSALWLIGAFACAVDPRVRN